VSEKAKFHNMTRPIRFRRLKQVKMITVLWCKALRERIKYLSNYILYKLGYLKRYSYRDMSVQVLPLPHQILAQTVQSSNFSGIAIMTLLLENNIDMDYFYREKDGQKKITLYMKNHDESRLFSETHLEDIHLKTDKWYSVSELPVFKVAVLDPEVKPFNPDEPLKEVEYTTTTYNVNILKTLRHKSLLGANIKPDNISEPMLHYYYNFAVGELKKYLDHLTLKDLMM